MTRNFVAQNALANLDYNRSYNHRSVIVQANDRTISNFCSCLLFSQFGSWRHFLEIGLSKFSSFFFSRFFDKCRNLMALSKFLVRSVPPLQKRDNPKEPLFIGFGCVSVKKKSEEESVLGALSCRSISTLNMD